MKVHEVISTKMLERMNVPKRYWDVSLDFVSPNCRENISSYLDNIDDAVYNGVGMLIIGDNGVGKTGIGCLVLQEARKYGHSGQFITAQQYLSDYESRDIRCNDSRAMTVDILMLDDLGREVSRFGHGTSKRAQTISGVFDNLIRYRQSQVKPTIVTTNLSVKALEEKYGKSFCQLFKQGFGVIKVDGPSLREIDREKDMIFFRKK